MTAFAFIYIIGYRLECAYKIIRLAKSSSKRGLLARQSPLLTRVFKEARLPLALPRFNQHLSYPYSLLFI
jgi:hypothetical protein